MLRRCVVAEPIASNELNSKLNFGPYTLDVEMHQLSKDQQDIPLTTGEFTLLRVFLENANKVLNRDTLLEKTKGYDHSPYDRSVDVCVGRLRKKIEVDPAEPVYLRTIWGAGYLFSMDE